MKKVRKAVIPAAGYGTRFLPATKAMPKEMLPIVDKPVIQYVVEEAVAAGIEDIIIITGWQKRAIEDHFDYPYELEKRLEEAGKERELEDIRRVAKMANFIYVRQKGPYGNGTPVLNAENIIGDEPFVVLWGDEFIYADPPRLVQMVEVYNQKGSSVISGVKIENKEDLSRYGIADTDTPDQDVFQIKRILEKPKPDDAPSQYAVHGAYLMMPELFKHLKKTKPGRGNEIWLVDAINSLAREQPVWGTLINNSRYYDTGNKAEYIKANIEFGLKHPETRDELKKYLKNLKPDEA
ncbi:UTP--glucose-1-phosphate uridylyltransferase [Patescibacteria group bacterium]